MKLNVFGRKISFFFRKNFIENSRELVFVCVRFFWQLGAESKSVNWKPEPNLNTYIFLLNRNKKITAWSPGVNSLLTNLHFDANKNALWVLKLRFLTYFTRFSTCAIGQFRKVFVSCMLISVCAFDGVRYRRVR